MLVSARNYRTKLLPMCIKRIGEIPHEYYYLITPYKTLHPYINKEVIEEFISSSLTELIDEIVWTKALSRVNNYYITSSYCTDNIEDIIKRSLRWNT